jgi:hypothetical protein
MSFKFEYDVFSDSINDIHSEECYPFNEYCDCEFITAKFNMCFKTIVGENSEYIFESNIGFFININDELDFEKFISLLKNPKNIDDVANESQENQSMSEIPLTKSRNLCYSREKKTLSLKLDSTRYYSMFEFNLNTEEIIFNSKDWQQCGNYCSCGDCEYYGRFETSLEVRIPFKTETKGKIIEAFEEVYEVFF